jgi:hypothetical protein
MTKSRLESSSDGIDVLNSGVVFHASLPPNILKRSVTSTGR